MKKDYIVELREEEADELMSDHWVGELIRCKNCKNRKHCEMQDGFGKSENWFCADGEQKKQ